MAIFVLCLPSCSTNIRNDLNQAHLKGKVLSVTEYTYAPSANIIDSGKTGRLISKSIRHYNPQGYLIDNTSYNPADSIDHKEVRTFDETGRPIKIISYDHTGSILFERVLKYNPKGHCIEITEYKASGLPSLISKFIYDDDNNLLESADYSIANTLCSRQLFSNYTQKYSPSKVTIQNFYNCTEIYCLLEHTNKFNSQGYIQEVTTMADGLFLETSTYQYKLDKSNNWIHCFKRTANVPSEILERSIEYYR
jgi:hypothetical protein